VTRAGGRRAKHCENAPAAATRRDGPRAAAMKPLDTAEATRDQQQMEMHTSKHEETGGHIIPSHLSQSAVRPNRKLRDNHCDNLHWPLAEVAKKFGKTVHAILWLAVFALSLLEEFCPPPRPEFCKLCAQITIGAHAVVESVAQRADIGLSVAHFSLVTDLCDLCDRYPPASQ